MIRKNAMHTLAILSLGLLISGCVHLKGVVLEDPTNKPLATAKFSVGRPGGIAVFETHGVDSHGAFDFYLVPTDANNIYLYDGAGDPQFTLRHLDERQFNNKMTIHMRPVRPNMEPGRDYVP